MAVGNVAVYAGVYSVTNEVITIKTLLQKDHKINLIREGEEWSEVAIVVDPSLTEIPAYKKRHKVVIIATRASLPKTLAELRQRGAYDAVTTDDGLGPAVKRIVEILGGL